MTHNIKAMVFMFFSIEKKNIADGSLAAISVSLPSTVSGRASGKRGC
jgi:hypothetical protein